MNLSNIEKETIINYNQAEQEAGVYTYDHTLIRKLDKLCAERDDISKIRDGDYIVPKKWIKVSPPRRLNLTPEQKRIRSERMSRLSRHSAIDSEASGNIMRTDFDNS